MRTVQKVLAYVTREKLGVRHVLVFEHCDFPEAGIQVPAGTVGAGEELQSAAKREVLEESGLWLSCDGKLIGTFEFERVDRDEVHIRNVFQFEALEDVPASWIHVVSGSGEDEDLRFRFYWLSGTVAQENLAADQGLYLSAIASIKL